MSFAEAKALDTLKLEEHGLALGGEFVKRAGSAVKFVMLHRSALCELRKRYSQQGRRNPVPGSPSWGELLQQCLPRIAAVYEQHPRCGIPQEVYGEEEEARPSALACGCRTRLPP